LPQSGVATKGEAHECLLTTWKTKLQLGILWTLKQGILTTHIFFPPC